MTETNLLSPNVGPSTSPGGPSPEDRGRIYFPQLDGLRFIAFFMVYLFHGGVEPSLLAKIIGRAPARAMQANGGMGVQLFFILSGFLITTLLLREEAVYGKILLRAFWVRRILRIWPLYYLVIFLGFFAIPAIEGGVFNEGFRQLIARHLLPFLGFAGNWSMIYRGPVPYDWLSILWSVCVEEQFYLVVPLIVAFVPGVLRIAVVVALMAGSIAVRSWCARTSGSQLALVFNTFAQFDTLLSGVLLALVLGDRRDRPRLTRIMSWAQWPLYLAVVWTLGRPHLGHGAAWNKTWDYVFVWLCGVGVVSAAVWGGGWLGACLARPWIVWLGKISYGLYMYHEIALWAGRKSMGMLPWIEHRDSIAAILGFGLTVAFSAASYYGFELRFLRLKRGWTRVPSRPV